MKYITKYIAISLCLLGIVTGCKKPEPIPTVETILDLEPKAVWQNFYEITKIPRPTGKEDKIRAYIKNYAHSLGLKTIVDENGNVIVHKPAYPGMENRKKVVLQGHMDMVPNVAEGVEHDFEKDPIQTRIEGDWVYANGTTLGADDGIGISTILAILADKTIQHGPLEALFTVDEEDGMTGAGNLRAEMLSGDIILNLDSEKEGEFCVGCAGSYTILATIPCTMETTPSNTEPYLLKISGLTGGHSGIDIIFERGNAIKILARVLTPLMEEYGVRVANFDGGNARNSIPLFSTANICIPKENVVNCKNYISTAISQIKSQYAETDPSLKVELTPCEMPQNVINAEQVLSTIHSINYAVDGVFRKNEYNDVEISSNLGTLRFENGEIKLLSMVRSMKDEGLHELANILQNNYESFGASVVLYDENPAWQPNYNSPIANKALEIYNRLFSKKGEIHTMHAGLECCYFSIKYPNADIISLGATLENPHTPEERCYIPSVERFYDLVITLLKEIPVKEGQ